MKFLPFLRLSLWLFRSPPSRGAWIEMVRLLLLLSVMSSPPSRGAWIEISWS